jgi:hypothetical protein
VRVDRRRPVMAVDLLKFGQDENRTRRRQRLSVVYDGRFSLADEIAAVAGDLAGRVAGLPAPVILRSRVADFVAVVGQLVGTVSTWLAEVDAREMTTHLGGGQREDAVRKIVGLLAKPQMPEVSDAGLASGAWVADCVEVVLPISAEFAALLERSHRPNADALRGVLSRSERLEELLRTTLDRGAAELSKRIDVAESQSVSVSAQADVRAELAELGVNLP